jgi:hypothetical protein
MAGTYSKYRHVVIADYLGAPDAECTASLEASLMTRLPKSFREFLDVANGGEMDFYYVDIDHPEMKVPRSFSILYGSKPRRPGSPFGVFEHEIKLSREAAQLPPQVLPFARDNSGCELYLDLTDYEDTGEDRVVAFIHGMPDLDGQPKDNAWVTVALHFDDYIAQLKLDEEYCREQLGIAVENRDRERQAKLVDFLDQAAPDWRDRAGFAPWKDLAGTTRN